MRNDLWAMTVPVVIVGLVVMTVVMVSLCGAVVRLARRSGLTVRITPRDGSAWTVEEFGLGYQTPAGVRWHHVRTTWPEAAAWASETSRRPDVTRAFVDVPSHGGATSWLWETGIQTHRTENAHA